MFENYVTLRLISNILLVKCAKSTGFFVEKGFFKQTIEIFSQIFLSIDNYLFPAIRLYHKIAIFT